LPQLKLANKISLRGLRTFCVAARFESFRAAADDLFLTASAISHQVKSLEEELGVKLFERGTRDLTLTPIGKALYDDISPLIEDIDAVLATHFEAAPRKSVRISVQPFFASEYFVPRLSDFTSEHPQIDIQVGTSDETAEKHPSDADLSIRLFKSPPADMPTNLLFPLCMVPAGSPTFKKRLRVKNKKILSDFPLIVHETRPKAWAQWQESSGVQLPQNSKVTRLDSMIAVVRATERGIGAALVPVPIADLWFQQGSIVRLFDDDLVADVSYYLVCTPGREDDEAVALLRDWILQNFTADPLENSHP
jgi:LysR family transcriptional regulator, glycine cleavage system transcriptional activator